MKNKIWILLAVILASVLLSGAAMAQEEVPGAENDHMMTIAIGTTGYTIDIPDDCTRREIDEEHRADDMVSRYYSEDSDLDIDIYQFELNDMSLEDYVKEESEEYGAEDVFFTSLNEIVLAFYRSVEERDENTYQAFNYLFPTGDKWYAEIVIWIHLDAHGMSPQEQLAMSIINSAKVAGIEVSAMEVRTDSPVGIRLVLKNLSEKPVTMDVSSFSLQCGDKRYSPVETSIVVQPGQDSTEYILDVGADKVEPGQEISLYYGNILLAAAGS